MDRKDQGRTGEQTRIDQARLQPSQRRERMLKEAERRGVMTETIGMLSLVRVVEGFTNMAAIYGAPDRKMLDAERVKGAQTEGQARARAWKRLRERREGLDRDFREKGLEYVRPSDWFILFAAFKKATNPGGNVPNVFAVQTSADRVAFRTWAEQFGLNGDGLVHAAQAMRHSVEEETHARFDATQAIKKIQAFTPEQLHEIIRAGFVPEDTYIRTEGDEHIPMLQLPARYDRFQTMDRSDFLRAKLSQQVDPKDPLRDQKYREFAKAYDAERFHAIGVDRNSSAYELPIVAGVFATVEKKGNETIGYGYHGVIEPELVKILPPGYLKEVRSKPYVRAHDGKTVVQVERSIINREGIGLMAVDEIVQGVQAESLQQAATRKIADAIVYKRDGEPYYWNDVHWVYKKLIENRLPFLAKLAGIDAAPIEKFSDEDAEKEWMRERILSSGITAQKQLNDKQEHFELTLEDVFTEESDRARLREAQMQYPETIKLGGYAFPVEYEWSADKQRIEKAIVKVEQSQRVYNNAFQLRSATPHELPKLGSKAHPVDLIFRYEEGSEFWRSPVREFPASRFRELLELIEPQERWLESRWRDFRSYSEQGKMAIPLTITVADTFPTPELMRILMGSNPESPVYTVDRDGVERHAFVTIRYGQGDAYHIQYVQKKEDAEHYLAAAKKKHAERQAAVQAREAMGDVLDEKLVNVRRMEAELEAFNKEFETDNLVAWVLGKLPYPDDEKQYIQSHLDENNFQAAETALGNRISDRKRQQELIDAMRKISATITELEALGFDWQKYDFNKRNREFREYQSPGRDGFFDGDIKLRHSEIYRPRMGRVVGYRLDDRRIRDQLRDLQKRLEYELYVWKLKKDKLREERAQAKEGSGPTTEEPEVVRRGFSDEDENEGEDEID